MTIQVKDLLDNFDTGLLDKMNITDKFLNLYLLEDKHNVNDVQKITQKKEGERNKYIFELEGVVLTIYDNPMRAVRELYVADNYKTYKTWNKDGVWTRRD